MSQLLSIQSLKTNKFKVAFLTKGEVLIYFAISKDKYESLTALRKQLEILHLQYIALTTSHVINSLKMNPSYDLVNEFSDYYHILNNQAN